MEFEILRGVGKDCSVVCIAQAASVELFCFVGWEGEKGATTMGYLMAALMHWVMMRIHWSGVALGLALVRMLCPLLLMVSMVAWI